MSLEKQTRCVVISEDLAGTKNTDHPLTLGPGPIHTALPEFLSP